MPANVEIKAKVTYFETLKKVASELSNLPEEILEQEDTFFHVPNGRLKLREFKGIGQLIQYERSNQSGPKQSDYHITIVRNPEDLKETLKRALGIKGIVKKTRLLYMIGQTRVHLDQVDGLGNFMELEVVLNPDQTVSEGEAVANHLMDKLGINETDLITGAYMDLILEKQQNNQNGDH
ncbi:uncharacterized protein LOC141913089 isoform X2 [Tubulanus polymorphus]